MPSMLTNQPAMWILFARALALCGDWLYEKRIGAGLSGAVKLQRLRQGRAFCDEACFWQFQSAVG
jgi:hypothetical protein